MKFSMYYLIVVWIILFSCTAEEKESVTANPLEGVWEYVESFTADTTYQHSPDLKAYKILYKDYFSLAGQNHPLEQNWGHAGKIRITEDTYVEYLDIVQAPEWVGDSAVFKYKLEGDIWTITYEDGSRTEKWKRIK